MLIILRGIPGSGKSTLAKTIVDTLGWKDIRQPFIVASADNFFTDGEGNYNFDYKSLSQAHKACRVEVLCALNYGKHVIVDNTHSRFWEYEEYIMMALIAKVDYVVITIHVERKANIQACYDRCIHKVPLEKIAGIWIRFDTFEDEIIVPLEYTTRSLDAGSYILEKLREVPGLNLP